MKEAIWWQGVDISLVQHNNSDPIPPPPRRTPQWGAVGKFFLSADSDAGYNKARQAAMNSQKHRDPAGRPFTAGASSPSKRGARKEPRPNAFSVQREKDARLQRPSSAPALLRNENLALKKPHEDAFCQKIEDMAVGRSLRWMKKEGLCKRDTIDAVDVLADPVLFDLKVLHNSSQRARTESIAKKQAAEEEARKRPVRGGRSGTGTKVRTAAAKMKDLCGQLDQDTKKHCARMKVPHMAIADSNLDQLVNKLHKIHATQLALKLKDMARPELDNESMAGFMSEMKGLWSAVAIVPGDWKHPLVKLAHFINGGHEGRMRTILQAFDVGFTGSLSQKDFIECLTFMAYPHGDYKQLFAMLDTDGAGELDLNWVEDRLMKLIGPEN